MNGLKGFKEIMVFFNTKVIQQKVAYYDVKLWSKIYVKYSSRGLQILHGP